MGSYVVGLIYLELKQIVNLCTVSYYLDNFSFLIFMNWVWIIKIINIVLLSLTHENVQNDEWSTFEKLGYALKKQNAFFSY